MEDLGRAVLFIDCLAACAMLCVAWVDLRDQASDMGRVGGVVALAALAFVLYFTGRAFLAFG